MWRVHICMYTWHVTGCQCVFQSTALKVTAAPKKAEPAPKSISVSVSSKPPSVQRQSSGTTSSGRSSRDATPPHTEPKTLEEVRVCRVCVCVCVCVDVQV